MLKAGGMLMPTEAHYLDDAYQGDRVKCGGTSNHNGFCVMFSRQVSDSWR
jgi:hypothetical protein